MSDIFISYARSTEAKAEQIAQALRALGYRVWRDDELPSHRAYAEVIEERLRAAKAVVVVWSADALRSQWVRAEADIARESGTLVQLSLDGTIPPLPFNQLQCTKLKDWKGDTDAPDWRKVVDGVANLVGERVRRDPHTGAARLQMIGGFQLRGPTGLPIVISSRRARALLAFLYLSPDHAAGREHLCQLLWSDCSEAQARPRLTQCLSELKRELSATGLRLLDAGRERIALRPELIASDVDQLQTALAGGGGAEALAATLDSMRPEALLADVEIGGRFEDWLELTREQFERSIANEVLGALKRLEAAGEWSKSRTVAEAYLRRNPLDEAIVAAAIRADLATGDTLAAHRRFQILQKAMARELGAAPGPAARDALANTVGASRPQSGATAIEIDPPLRTDTVGPPIIVVAAFEADEGAESDKRHAANLRDEVVSGLSRFRDLRVITDPRDLERVSDDASAERAGAHALGASLVNDANGARLIVQLLRIGDRGVIWSERFALPGSSVVGDIDGIIAQAVGAVLPAINADLLRRASNLPSDQAYQRYLVARDMAYRPPTFAAACAAVAELEALISAYPTFPLPYLALARLYNTDFACTRAGSSGPKERLRALQLAKRALSLDRGQSYGYTAVGWSYLRRREWETARTHLQQALTLNPFHAGRVMEVGYGLVFLGDIKQADLLLNRCLLLNPAPEDGFFSDLGVLAMVQGEYERAATYFDLVANPRTWGLIYAAMNARAGGFARGDELAAAMQRISEIWPEDKAMDDDAVVGWIADHHPFRVKETEETFLRAARGMLADR